MLHVTYISKIEAVQRRFTKRLSGFHSLTYAQRLQRLNVESLEERRIKFDMHTIFKIVHKLVDINDELFIRSVESLNLRGHNQRFFKPQVRLNCRALAETLMCGTRCLRQQWIAKVLLLSRMH